MNKPIKLKSMQHYTRMIRWAEKQNPEEEVDYGKMTREIGECWFGQFCDYCEKAINDCTICKLGRNSGCCSGLWMDLDDSETWSEWGIKAKRVRKYIKEKG